MKSVPFSALGIIVAFVVLYGTKLIRAEPNDNNRSPVVQTESGAVVGKIETLPQGKSVHEYLGIPYAEPPIGELRFAAPKPAKPWSGIKRVKDFGAPCPQTLLPFPVNSEQPDSEDCLFLNVFVPSTIKHDEKLAVMVWIHGGAFAFGSSSDHPAGVLAAFNDVIVVSMNYRLGVLGFLTIPDSNFTGNYGMFDQVLALKWVKANIASFGGDPNRVTIFGQSAGGMSVSLHLVSPLSKGLFNRAIMQSGASSSPRGLYAGNVNETKPLELFAKLLNCSLGPDLVDCVRGKSIDELTMALSGITTSTFTGPQNLVGPTVDGNFLPDLPEILFNTGQFHPGVDVITGVNSNEGDLFLLVMPRDQVKDGVTQEMFEFAVRNGMIYAREKNTFVEDLILFEYTDLADPDNKIAIRQLMSDSFGDSAFAAPSMLEAKALAKGGRPPYAYVFNHRLVFSTLPDWIGVMHFMELPFVLGAPFKNIPDPFVNLLAGNYSEIEEGLSSYIMKLWTDFAKYGSPNPPGSGPAVVTWPKFTEEEQKYLVLDLIPRVEQRYRANKLAFWNEIVPKVFDNEKEKKKAYEN